MLVLILIEVDVLIALRVFLNSSSFGYALSHAENEFPLSLNLRLPYVSVPHIGYIDKNPLLAKPAVAFSFESQSIFIG